MNLGNAIKAIRHHFDLSQEQLSADTGISQTSISQLENGIKNPSKRTINTICEIYEIPEAVFYVLAMEASDVPDSRKEVFNTLYPEMKKFVEQVLGRRKTKILR